MSIQKGSMNTPHAGAVTSSIQQFHLHICTKNAARHIYAKASDSILEPLDERFGQRGRRGIGITWSSPLPRIGIQSEL